MQDRAEQPHDAAPDVTGPRLPRWLLPIVAVLEWVPWRIVGAIVGLALFGTALWVLHHVLREVRYADVRTAFENVTWQQLGISLAATAFSYIALTGYDLFGLRHIGRRDVPYRTAALSAFTGYALSYTIGFQVFVAAAVRYRTYAEAGLSAVEVAALTLVSGLTFWLGIMLVLGVSLGTQAQELTFLEGYGTTLSRTVGIVLMLGIGIYLGWLFRRQRAVNAFGFRLPLPGFRSTLAQLGVGVADIIGASAALYVLLPPTPDLTFVVFTAIFIVALCLGMASHAPGGAGVIEATMLIALPSVGADRLLAALMLWRLIYYLLPFTLALITLAVIEVTRRRGFLARGRVALAVTLRPVAPVVVATAVFVAGAAALILNVLPPAAWRMTLTRNYVPLPLFELAHIAIAIIGISLMILSRGLLRRIAIASRIVRVLLLVGMAAALLRGIDFWTAGILLVALGLMQINRRAFYRRDDLSDAPLSPPWLAATATVFLGALWIGVLIHGTHPAQVEHVTGFSWSNDLARLYRAAIAGLVIAAVLLLLGFRRQRPERSLPPEVVALLAEGGRADASALLDGGYRFLLTDSRDAFIPYVVTGRSWIATGDPVGAAGRGSELAWSFRDLAERGGGWPVFFDASGARVPVFNDLGLGSLHYGDDATIDLGGGGHLLHAPTPARTTRPADAGGLSIRVVSGRAIPPLVRDLRAIDPRWPTYPGVTAFPLVVAFRDGKPVCFGRLLGSSDRNEMSLDGIRTVEPHSEELLRLLLDAAIAYARREGYRRFDLGTAPSDEIVPADGGPGLDREALGLFRYGDFFTELSALRNFKQVYAPIWTPRYLACPGGLALPSVLRDITTACGREIRHG